MKKFRTVLGDLPESSMGNTYSHEHLYVVHPSSDKTLTITDVDKTLKELLLFKMAGGDVIVEGTPADLGRNIKALKKMSILSGVKIVCSTGNYLFPFLNDIIAKKSIDDIADNYVKEISEGIDGTNIKAGQIKIAISLKYIHKYENKILRAAARAQLKTNAPIWIHHGGLVNEDIIDILISEGANLEKVILGHIDRNPDIYEILKLAKTGVNFSIDNITRVNRYPLQVNIDVIKSLIAEGHIGQIFVSGDFGRTTYYKAYDGGPGLEYILQKFISRLKMQLQLNNEEINKIFIQNPRRIYSFIE